MSFSSTFILLNMADDDNEHKKLPRLKHSKVVRVVSNMANKVTEHNHWYRHRSLGIPPLCYMGMFSGMALCVSIRDTYPPRYYRSQDNDDYDSRNFPTTLTVNNDDDDDDDLTLLET